MSSEPIPPWLLAPVAREHRPPVRPRAMLLPFAELDPTDFERLCLALAREDGEPEACRLYGTRGQAQAGIDLYARLGNGRYATYQCKHYEQVIDSDIKNAVPSVTRAGKTAKTPSASARRIVGLRPTPRSLSQALGRPRP